MHHVRSALAGLALLGSLALLSASCGSESSSPGGAAGSSSAGTGAIAGTGGAPGGTGGIPGGTAGVTGGTGGTGGATTGPPCCGGIGQCIAAAEVPPDAAKNLSPDVCDAGALCAPLTFSDPTFRPQACTSAASAEGRCVSQCFTAGVGAAQFLPQDVCMPGEICVPCFNPVDSLATGACGQNGDMPTRPPTVFADCCANLGKCVPTALVPPERQMQLPQDTCMGTEKCAPTALILDPTLKFAPCTANILLQMLPGACVPACLAGMQASLLMQATCQAGELCAPCVNPLDMMPTGACM